MSQSSFFEMKWVTHSHHYDCCSCFRRSLFSLLFVTRWLMLPVSVTLSVAVFIIVVMSVDENHLEERVLTEAVCFTIFLCYTCTDYFCVMCFCLCSLLFTNCRWMMIMILLMVRHLRDFWEVQIEDAMLMFDKQTNRHRGKSGFLSHFWQTDNFQSPPDAN